MQIGIWRSMAQIDADWYMVQHGADVCRLVHGAAWRRLMQIGTWCGMAQIGADWYICLLYRSPSRGDRRLAGMPSDDRRTERRVGEGGEEMWLRGVQRGGEREGGWVKAGLNGGE